MYVVKIGRLSVNESETYSMNNYCDPHSELIFHSKSILGGTCETLKLLLRL